MQIKVKKIKPDSVSEILIKFMVMSDIQVNHFFNPLCMEVLLRQHALEVDGITINI